jgi:LPXTG cell wall anchor motif
MKPFQKILIIDIGSLIACFFLIWTLTADSDFLIHTYQVDYLKSLPLALMYTTLVGILIVLGTVLLFLPRRKKL